MSNYKGVLELHGKRWFDRKNGNTYFSALAIYNGREIKRIAYEYGYGDQWLQSITDDLVVEGLVRGDQWPWQFIDQLKSNNICVVSNCADVSRKKDL